MRINALQGLGVHNMIELNYFVSNSFAPLLYLMSLHSSIIFAYDTIRGSLANPQNSLGCYGAVQFGLLCALCVMCITEVTSKQHWSPLGHWHIVCLACLNLLFAVLLEEFA